MSKYILNKLNGSIIVFLVVFTCQLVLKRDAIFGNILIEDDLILFPKAILGIDGGGGWHYYLSAHLLQSLAFDKIYHLFLLSISAVLLWLILYQFFQRKGILLAALLVAFLAPMTVDQAVFISGSHPAVGLAMTGIGFLLSYRALCANHRYGIRVLLTISAGILYLFAAIFSALFYLVFLAPLLLPWWHNKDLVGGKWKLVGLLLISTFTVPLIQLTRHFLFHQSIVYHYASIPGWTDYSLTNVINQFVKFFQTFIGQFGILALFLLLALLLLILLIFLSRPKGEEPKYNRNEAPYYVSGLLFLSAVFVLTMAPISATVFMWSRYVIAPGIFFTLLAFLVLDYALNGLTKKYPLLLSSRTYTYLSLIGLLVLVGFVCNSYYRTYDAYDKTYGNLIKTEIMLDNFILDEQQDWEENAQIVILVNDFPGKFTYGFNHWSTWYLRYITKRQDVIGLIGQEEWLVHYPFVDEYRDHGEEYWYETQREGTSLIARKRMVGLEQRRPTYIYRIGENFIEVINWIKIQDAARIDLYHATVSGIEYEGQYTITNISEVNNEYGINIGNSITYTVSPVEIPPLEVIPTSGSLYFDGTKDIHRELGHKDVKDFTLELLFRSDPVANQDYSYDTTSPPMPLLFLPLMAIYQVSDDQLNIRIGENPASPSKIITLYNDDWIYFALTVRDRREMVVYVNGYPYDRIEDNFALGDTLTVGRGFDERFWRGWIHYLVINEGILYDGAYSPSLTPIETEQTLLCIKGETWAKPVKVLDTELEYCPPYLAS